MGVFNLIIIGFGLLCFYFGILSLRRAHEILTTGKQTVATVVAIEETVIPSTQGGMRAKGFHAIYSYRDESGTEHRLPGTTKSTNKDRFVLGVEKTVVFDPESPSDVVDAGNSQYVGGAIYLLVAVGIVGIGIARFIYGIE